MLTGLCGSSIKYSKVVEDMNYVKLKAYSNILDSKDQLKAYANFYSSFEINGLHYVDFYSKKNIVRIYTPANKLHYYSSCFFLKQIYSGTPINTVLRQAHELRKFLDFLIYWNIDLLKVDTLIIVEAFVSYLRLLKNQRALANGAIDWSLCKRIPLHERAERFGKVAAIALNKEGIMVQDKFEDLSPNTIKDCIKTACTYLEFLKEETYEFIDMDLTPIPVRLIEVTTRETGTTGKKASKLVTNIKAILSGANFNENNDEIIKPLSEEVMTEERVNNFLSLIPPNDVQSKLLFLILKSFGLRRAEAGNLMFYSKNVPKDFYGWDVNKATDWLKNEMQGDLEFDNNLNKWVCNVVKRKVTNFQSQNKTIKNRLIPLLFSQQELTNLLLQHVIKRQIDMELSGQEHDYVFYSNSNNAKGEPITGGAIYSKYRHIITGTEEEDYYLKFSPHAFRHFFATHLIRIKRIPIYDVSMFLGHADEKVTKRIYLHYIPGNEELSVDSPIEDMVSTFKND